MHKILQITVDLLNSDRSALLGLKIDFSLKEIITGVLLNVIFISIACILRIKEQILGLDIICI